MATGIYRSAWALGTVLDYWRRRFAEEHTGGFVEVGLLPENLSSAEAALELFTPDGTHVR